MDHDQVRDQCFMKGVKRVIHRIARTTGTPLIQTSVILQASGILVERMHRRVDIAAFRADHEVDRWAG